MNRPKKLRLQYSVTQDTADMVKALQTDPLYTESQWFTLLIRRLYADQLSSTKSNQTTTTQPKEAQRSSPTTTIPEQDDESYKLLPGYNPRDTRGGTKSQSKVDARSIIDMIDDPDEVY